VNRIEFANVLGSAVGEFLACQILEAIPCLNGGETLFHLRRDVRRETEHVTALGDIDGSILPGPAIDILKYVAVNLAVTVRTERNAGRQSLHPVGRHQPLKTLKFLAVADALFVDKGVSARIDVRVSHYSAACAFVDRWARL
jgi:hypothetical protein